VIDGLKLTFSGEELRALLEERRQAHEEKARGWTSEARQVQADATDAAVVLPGHLCEQEAERHAWRATALAFMRDHLDPAETYRLDTADLEYSELLPGMPRWMEQDDYEERTRIGFNLERLVTSLDGLVALYEPVCARGASGRGGPVIARARPAESSPSEVNPGVACPW
jgi:hypothetical protein